MGGLPWWLSGKESICQSRRHRYDPWFGKTPHTLEQLSSCATTVEPCSKASEWQLLSLLGTRAEACALQREAWVLQGAVAPAHNERKVRTASPKKF